MREIVIYTAIAGDYDVLSRLPAELEGVDFVAFVENDKPVYPWHLKKVHSEFADPCRNAKIHKILPHVYFPEARYSLWIDGCIKLKFPFPIQAFINQHLAKHDLAVFKHYSRACIYEEAEACIQQQKDDPEIISRQMNKYRAAGYPAQNGLAECPVILRRHTKEVRQFNEAWYEEIKNHSRRDQLSFNYIARKLGFEFCHLPGAIRGKISNPWFCSQRHKSQTHAGPIQSPA